MFLKSLRTALISILLFTVLTGLIYPLVVTGIAQLVFPGKANGSLLMKNGKAIGSELIGQPFSSSKSVCNFSVRVHRRCLIRVELRTAEPLSS